MVSTYMMNLLKLARDNGLFSQYEDSQVSRNPQQRSRAGSETKSTLDDTEGLCSPLGDTPGASITNE